MRELQMEKIEDKMELEMVNGGGLHMVYTLGMEGAKAGFIVGGCIDPLGGEVVGANVGALVGALAGCL